MKFWKKKIKKKYWSWIVLEQQNIQKYMVLHLKSSTKGLAPILPVHRVQQTFNFDYLMNNNLWSIVDANMSF